MVATFLQVTQSIVSYDFLPWPKQFNEPGFMPVWHKKHFAQSRENVTQDQKLTNMRL